MHSLVAEYRALPPSTDHLPDDGLNSRKREILFAPYEQANDPDVSQLLLDVLRNPLEFDLARVEAMKLVNTFVEGDNPLCEELWSAVRRIAESEGHHDDDLLAMWAQGFLQDRQERGGGA